MDEGFYAYRDIFRKIRVLDLDNKNRNKFGSDTD
jgi:hypothetical protein